MSACCVLEALPRARVTTTRSTRIEVSVPSYAVGAIIGTKGANIREVAYYTVTTFKMNLYYLFQFIAVSAGLKSYTTPL